MRLVSIRHFNPKAMPTNDTDNSCLINIAEVVYPIKQGSYHTTSHH